jgi:hypothetical protein
MGAFNENYIEGLGQVVCCNFTNFTPAANRVLEQCDSLISMRDLAYIQITDAKNSKGYNNSTLCRNGSYVKEGSIAWTQGGLVRRALLAESLLLDKKAPTKTYKDRPYILGNVEEYLEQIGKDNYCILKNKIIPTDGFEDFDETRWAFKDLAKAYGNFLKSEGLSEIELLIHPYEKPQKQEVLHNIGQIYVDSITTWTINPNLTPDKKFKTCYIQSLNDNESCLRVQGVRRPSVKEIVRKTSMIV